MGKQLWRELAAQLLGVTGVLLIGVWWVLPWIQRNVDPPWGPPRTVRDPSAYPTLRRQWVEMGLGSHFPPTIPAAAQHVRLSAFPGFLQGGAHLQLRFRLPPDEFRQAVRSLTPAGKREWPRDPPVPAFHTGEKGEREATLDEFFTVAFLGAEDRGAHSFPWNHGSTYGLAFHRATHEVVYWAENW